MKKRTVKEMIDESKFNIHPNNEFAIIGVLNSHNKKSIDFIPKFKTVEEFDKLLNKVWSVDIDLLSTELTEDQLVELLYNDVNQL